MSARWRRRGLILSHDLRFFQADMAFSVGKYCWASSERPKVLVFLSIIVLVLFDIAKVQKIIEN